MRLNEKRFYTYAAVSDLYQQQCGEFGVIEFFRSTFAESVKANGGYAPQLESWEPLSSRQIKDIGLTPYKETTWYRLNGSAIEGRLVGATVQ